MEGDGGMVAMAHALKEAGLVFMVNDGGCKANNSGPMISYNNSSPVHHDHHWGTSQAAQTPHFNYRNNCQSSHCQVSSNLPAKRGHLHSRCAYQSPTRFMTNKTGFCHNNAYSLARGYQSSVVITNTLIKSSSSRSQRSSRRRRSDFTSQYFVKPRRSRISNGMSNTLPCNMDVVTRRSRCKTWMERCTLDSSYDYLKSPVNRLSPTRVSEVHYLDDISRYVRKSLRNLSPASDYEPCRFLSNRLMEHKKKCPKDNSNSYNEASGSNKRNPQIAVSSEAQTSASYDENFMPRFPPDSCMMNSQSVQASHRQLEDICECDPPAFSLRKLRFLPLPSCLEVMNSDSAEYHEWLDDKLREIIHDWIKSIPISSDFDDNDKEIRKILARELRAELLRLINDDKFDKEAKEIVFNSLVKMPMWYPEDDKNKFQEKIANKLLNNFNQFVSNLKMFDMLFDEWFEELKLKPVDERGRELNKENIKTQLSHSIKPIVVDRIIEDEFKTNLKNETLNIVEDLPLDVKENQNQYVKEVASKLIDSLTKTDREKILEKTKKDTIKSEESDTTAITNESVESEKLEYNKKNKKEPSNKGKKKTNKESSKKRSSRSSNDSSASNRRSSRNHEDIINVSLTLSRRPSIESKDSKLKIAEINNLICDWLSTVPQLTEICKENEKTVIRHARQVAQIEEDGVKDDETREEALKEEVMTWLGDVVEKEKEKLKPTSISKLTNDLVNRLERVYIEPLEKNMKEQESDDPFTKKVKMTVMKKAKKHLTNSLMERLEYLILKPPELKQELEVKEEENESDDIPDWLNEVPGLDEAIKRKKYENPKTMAILADIMSLSNLEYDFGEVIKKDFNEDNEIRYSMNHHEKELFDKLSKKLFLVNDDEGVRLDLENDIKDYIDMICKKKGKYLDYETKCTIATRLIAEAKLTLDQEKIAHDTSKKLIKSLQTWSSLLSFDSEQADTDSSDKFEYSKKMTANRKRWDKDIGFQFSSSETENSVSRSPSPVELLKNRQKMNTYNFVSKTLSNRSSPDPNRREAARDNIVSTSGQAAASEAIQHKSYNHNGNKKYIRDKPESSLYESKSNVYITYPINNLERFKRKPSTTVCNIDDKKVKRKDELKKQISKLEKDTKRSISNIIEKGKYKLPTANSNQVKREIIEVLRQKVGLSEVEAWPLAENIMKKAKTVYKSNDDHIDLGEVIRDEMRDVLDEAGITTRRDELEQSLTDLLSDEVLSGGLNTLTKSSVFKIIRSADLNDPIADSLTSQVMKKANEINEKVKSNKCGIKITSNTFRDIASREITDLFEGRIDELTPYMKNKICEATPHLIEKLENIISNTLKIPEDKTHEIKSELNTFFRNISLDKDAGEDIIADKLIRRLYVRMNPARSKQSNTRTSQFRLSNDVERSSETLQPPSSIQEFIKLATKEITDLLDEKCSHITKEYRDQLIQPTSNLLDKLGDIIADNKIRQVDKRKLIRQDIAKFFIELSIYIEDSPEDCSKQLMFKLEAILPNFLHSDEANGSRWINIQSNLTDSSDNPLTDKVQYNRRMSIAVPEGRWEEAKNVLFNINANQITDYITAKTVRTNSNAGSNSRERTRQSSMNAGRNTNSNSNTDKISNSSVNQFSSPIINQKGANPNKPINNRSIQSEADDGTTEKEILELIFTNMHELSQKEMNQVKGTTNQLVQMAKTISLDPDINIGDKIYQLKDCITNYLKFIPLADEKSKEEVTTKILSKLENKLFNRGFASSTPRQSVESADVLKTKEQCYINQLNSLIENWVHELPIIQGSIQDSNLKQDMIDNLVTDIDNRQRYLQLNLETKPCCEEELENLKYQVFRWLNKFLDIDDLSPFLSNIATLMDRIRRVSVPNLVKPSSKTLQEEICKFVELTPPHLLATDDITYQQQVVKELADMLQFEIEKYDANERVDNALQSWIPKMFTGTIQDLNRLADMLRSTLKKKGLLESKVDKAQKKAFDVLNDTIENWCDDLPLYGNLEEQEYVRKIKNNLSNKLMHKIAQLNLDPQIFNDEFLYQDIMSDEIDKLTKWLPKNPELEKYLPALKKDLVSQIKFARQKILEEIAGQAYKHQLRDVISISLRTPEALTIEELASLELVKENLVDAFISVHYSFDSVEGKRLLKDRITKEINKYCYDFFRRHPTSSINSTKINSELYEALLSVPLPTDESLRVEVEQVHIKNIIKEWMRDLPFKEETGREQLTRTKIITILAKRLHEIEQEKGLDPNLDINTKMYEKIIKTVRKLALKPFNESYLPKITLKLVEKLRQTEDYRYGHTYHSKDETNNTVGDPTCSCSSRKVSGFPKRGLSISDKVCLQKIRERVRSSCYKDASVNPVPVDTGSQVDLTLYLPPEKPVYETYSGQRLFPNICSRVDPVSPKFCQSSTQTTQCTKKPSQEILPQVNVRQYCWDSTESPAICSRKENEVYPPTSCKVNEQRNNVRDCATQDETSCLAKNQSRQCKCDSCSKERTKMSPQKSPQKSPQSSTDNIARSSHESWEAERSCGKRNRVRRCRTRCQELGEYLQRYDDELPYWDESRPILKTNILNIPEDIEAFQRMRICKCEEKFKPRKNNRSDEKPRPCDHDEECPKCLHSSCPHRSFVFFR